MRRPLLLHPSFWFILLVIGQTVGAATTRKRQTLESNEEVEEVEEVEVEQGKEVEEVEVEQVEVEEVEPVRTNGHRKSGEHFWDHVMEDSTDTKTEDLSFSIQEDTKGA